MKGLTLTQPWATLVASGEKRIETRSWTTSYRGLLVIHAAKGFPAGARALCVQAPFAAALGRAGIGGLGLLIPQKALPLGKVLAVVELTDVLPTSTMRVEDASVAISEQERAFGDYGPGRFAWILERVRALKEPIPVRGALGLWTPSPAIETIMRHEAMLRAPDEVREEMGL